MTPARRGEVRAAPVPAEILGEPVGTMVGTTMARIEDGIRALFDLG